MERITLARRVLLHLYGYRHIDPDSRYEAPFDITQDGIGTAIGISRSHASLVLGQMEKKGLIRSQQATVSSGGNGPTVRKVYGLTADGTLECEGLMSSARENGLDLEQILPRNINHCRSDMFDAMDRCDRDVLGSLFVISGKVSADSLPRGKGQPLVPVDSKGYVVLKEETRRRYLSRATREELRRWNSIAADWCTDNGRSVGERVIHLANAGRMREAHRLASENPYRMMDSADRRLAEALDAVDVSCGGGRLSAVVTMCFVRLGDPARARTAVIRMGGSDPCLSGALESEILLAEGRKSMALETALESYCGDAPTALALGKSMAENGRHSEAVVFLRRSRNSMSESGCLFRLEEALRWESESYLVLGQTQLAARLMEIASYAAGDRDPGGELRTRAEAMASQDRVGSERIHV